MGKIILQTERLQLREFVPEDAAAFLPLGSHPEITRFTGDGGITNIAQARQVLLDHPIADYEKYGFGRWACVLRETGCVIGFAGLKYLTDLKVVDIGYRLLPEYWGQGLATEASRAVLKFGLESLGLKRVIGLVLPENIASVRVLEKLGLRFEGRIEYRGQMVACHGLTVEEGP